MAKTTVITDDLDGSAGAETVTFTWDGSTYTIDLAKKNRAALEKALKPYIEAAVKTPSRQRRSAPRRRQPARSSKTPVELAAVRAWAGENGIAVSSRGRVAQSVLDAYAGAHR